MARPCWNAESPGATVLLTLSFRRDPLAASHPDSAVALFEQFPSNGCDVMEPEIDFANWALTVSGVVTRPGPYTLDQIRA